MEDEHIANSNVGEEMLGSHSQGALPKGMEQKL